MPSRRVLARGSVVATVLTAGLALGSSSAHADTDFGPLRRVGVSAGGVSVALRCPSSQNRGPCVGTISLARIPRSGAPTVVDIGFAPSAPGKAPKRITLCVPPAGNPTAC